MLEVELLLNPRDFDQLKYFSSLPHVQKALDLFEEMKMRNLPITVVSYGSAISACDKGMSLHAESVIGNGIGCL